MQEIILIGNSKTQKVIGAVFDVDAGGTEEPLKYKGTTNTNHKSLRLFLDRKVLVESVDDEGNIFRHNVNLSVAGSMKYVTRYMPTYWYVVKRLKASYLDKDRIFKQYADKTEDSIVWS